MAKASVKSVDAYIAAQPEEAQAALRDVRAAVRKALPGAEETIAYNIPTYRLNGGFVLSFAAWKRHWSLYPASERLLARFADDLAEATINKHTIRFSLAAPVPVKLIARIAKFRVTEQMERGKIAVTRGAARRPPPKQSS